MMLKRVACLGLLAALISGTASNAVAAGWVGLAALAMGPLSGLVGEGPWRGGDVRRHQGFYGAPDRGRYRGGYGGGYGTYRGGYDGYGPYSGGYAGYDPYRGYGYSAYGGYDCDYDRYGWYGW